MIEAREFGASLRRQRERRGISLDEIAEHTKVSVSLLAGLEQGDVGRWPTGIFRRAFVRAYAQAVGLDEEDTLLEFMRVFPEDGSPVRPRTNLNGHALRLTLAHAPSVPHDARRLAGLGIDTLVVGALAGLTWATDPSAWAPAVVAAGAIVWHGCGAVAWGMSPGAWLTRHRHAVLRTSEISLDAQPAQAPAAEIESRATEPTEAQPIRLSLGTTPPSARTRVARRDRRGGRPDRSHGTDIRM